MIDLAIELLGGTGLALLAFAFWPRSRVRRVWGELSSSDVAASLRRGRR